MEEKEHKIDVFVEVTVTDDGKSDYTPSPLYRLPWGWACIVSTILFVLNVEYGEKVFGTSIHENVANVLLWTMFVAYVLFISKLVDRHEKEEGDGTVTGCNYPYFGF